MSALNTVVCSNKSVSLSLTHTHTHTHTHIEKERQKVRNRQREREREVCGISSYVQKVGLLVIDEVHLLGTDKCFGILLQALTVTSSDQTQMLLFLLVKGDH
jgi:hypothetical protein